MKKGTIIAIVVAILLIVVGGMILVFGLSYAYTTTTETPLTEQEILISESFQDVVINTECDVHFAPYNGEPDAQLTITGETEQIHHEVTVEEGVLKIKMIDNRNWTDYIHIGDTEKMEMTLYLPNMAYNSIRITSNVGDVRIPGVLKAKELQVRTSVGDVWLEGGPVEMLDCMVSTGDITVRGGEGMVMKLRVGTGDLDVEGVTAQELHLGIETGDVEAENVVAPVFTVNGGTGDVEIENVQAEEYLQLFTTTGEIHAQNCQANDVNIESSTGSITVPAAWQFQRIETGTGKIKFE